MDVFYSTRMFCSVEIIIISALAELIFPGEGVADSGGGWDQM